MLQVKLIVTGDDFGYCPRRNQGIVDCFLAGAISNVSLLVNGSAAADAAKLARRCIQPYPAMAGALAAVKRFPHLVTQAQVQLLLIGSCVYKQSPVSPLSYLFMSQRLTQTLSTQMTNSLDQWRKQEEWIYPQLREEA